MVENPWHVDCIQAFLFFKCPECVFDTKEEYKFQDHAVEKHPLSFVLFGKQQLEEEGEDNFMEIKKEEFDYTDSFCTIKNESVPLNGKENIDLLDVKENKLSPFKGFIS